MQAEVAEILAGRDRFDPEITPKLEAYVEEQVLDRRLRMACRRLLAQARSIVPCPPPPAAAGPDSRDDFHLCE
jgi:hypothetical protein